MRTLLLLLALLAATASLAYADDWDDDRVVHNRRAAANDDARESVPADSEDAEAEDDAEAQAKDADLPEGKSEAGERPLGNYFGSGDEFRLQGVGTSRRERRRTAHDAESTGTAPRSAIFAPRHQAEEAPAAAPDPEPEEPDTTETAPLAETPGFSVVDMNDAIYLEDEPVDFAPLSLLPAEEPITDELARDELIYDETVSYEPPADESSDSEGELRDALAEYSELFTDPEPVTPDASEDAPLLDLSAELAAASPAPLTADLASSSEPVEASEAMLEPDVATSDASENTTADPPTNGVIAAPVRAPAAPAPPEGLERMSTYPAMQGLRKGKPRRFADQTAEERNRAESEAEATAPRQGATSGEDDDADAETDSAENPRVNRDDPDEW